MNITCRSPLQTNPIPPQWPEFSEAQMAAVNDVLRSGRVNYWTGMQGRAFENELSQYFSVNHAIAVANGTLALELALYGLGIGPGDEVIVPSRTFIATASSVVARGARPVVADVDAVSQGLSAATVLACITARTKAVIAVHLGGWPCDIDSLQGLCASKKIAIVEDCAQAHGAQLRGRPVGSLGCIAALSFCQDKIMTTGGEGGAVLTSDAALYERMWSYKDHGKDLVAASQSGGNGAEFKWLHNTFGSNMRMTEMQAAIGRLALKSLPAWLKRRQEIAASLTSVCRGFTAIRVPVPGPSVTPAYYRFYFFVEEALLRSDWTRNRLVRELRNLGINCGVGSCGEIFRESAFPPHWRPRSPHPIARQMARESIAISIAPNWSDSYLDHVVGSLATVLSSASPTKSNLRAA